FREAAAFDRAHALFAGHAAADAATTARHQPTAFAVFPFVPEFTVRYVLGSNRLHRRWLLLLDLEDDLAARGRGQGFEGMRALRPRRLRGRNVLRPGMRGAVDLHRKLPAAGLEAVLYRGRQYLS